MLKNFLILYEEYIIMYLIEIPLLILWQANTGAQQPSGVLDSNTISAITDAEKRLTGEDDPIKGGPTAQAQKHANEPINSQSLHDITEGEKKITGGERVKGGPTATAQSELNRSRL